MNKHFLALATLLAAGLPVANAQVLPDGNFDALAAGSAPDCGVPAGAWQFPPTCPLCEPYDSAFSVVNTNEFDATRQGRSLHVNVSGSATTDGIALTNILATPITPASGRTIRSTWEIFVTQQHTGGNLPVAVYIGADMSGGVCNFATDRGPQMAWWGDGRLTVYTPVGALTVVPQYPRDAWQSVQVDIHLDSQTWDFYWAPTGQPLQLIANNLTFRSTAFPFTAIDRWSVAHFDATGTFTSDCYIDNVTLALLGACPADFDGNGQITPADVAAFVNAWFTSLTQGTLVGDFDGNGAVEPADVATFVVAWFAALSGGC